MQRERERKQERREEKEEEETKARTSEGQLREGILLSFPLELVGHTDA